MIYLNTDGGARGNPGEAAVGFIITNPDGEIIKKDGKCIGVSTNNIAEYTGLILGLKEALQLDDKEIICRLDSELVVKQLNGEYRVKDAKLKSLFGDVIALSSMFKSVRFEHVLRSKNSGADKIVNQTLDSKM